MTRDILETIDHVIDDWTTSQDAMRWLPEAPPEPDPALVVIDDDGPWLSAELWDEARLDAFLVEALRPLVELLVAEMDAVARAINETLGHGWQLPHLSWGFSFVDPSPIPVLTEVAIRDAVEHFGDVAWIVEHEGWLPGPVSLARHFPGEQLPAPRGQRSPGPVSETYSRRGLHQ